MKYLLLVILLIGCSKPGPQIEDEVSYNCTKNAGDTLYQIQLCIKSAGVGGESEPEDWLGKCETIVKDLMCTKETRKKCVRFCK